MLGGAGFGDPFVVEAGGPLGRISVWNIINRK